MSHKIALIPGDGIGMEVIPEGVRVLEALARSFDFAMEFTDFPFSCSYYLEHGEMMPEDGIDQLKPFDAILLGLSVPTRYLTMFHCGDCFCRSGGSSIST